MVFGVNVITESSGAEENIEKLTVRILAKDLAPSCLVKNCAGLKGRDKGAKFLESVG